jgi:predicted porin
VKGKIEVGVRFLEGENFNNDANSSFEFAENPIARNNVFFARLAYASIQHKKWGRLSIGKQWGFITILERILIISLFLVVYRMVLM